MDREKVIELFSSCISKGGWNNCTNCEHGKEQAVLTCKPLAENVLKVLKEQNTVDHALEVLRQAGWTESQDVPLSDSACWNCNHCHDGGALSGWFCDIHGDLNKCNRLVYRCKAWTERLQL